MHQFLRRREDQIINEMRIKEEDAVENMSQSLNAMKRALSECGELKESWTHIMEVPDPEKFLRRWSEEHSAAAGDLFRERTEGLAVVQSPVFQGPYQSHLQFFMWKEMLQEVEPKAEALTLKDDNPSVTVSEDRRSFHSAPQSGLHFGHSRRQHEQDIYHSLFGQPNAVADFTFGTATGQMRMTTGYASIVPESLSVSSSSTFSSGQHYWEVELRLRDFWCVGITDYFLKHEDQKYFVCEANSSTELFPGGRLLKLGVYLNCSSKTLTFYDADSMKRLHQIHCRGLSLPVSAYFCIRHKEPDTNLITVCRY
uniref:B30.2/SPRY domain-containing protein n=1 Tax=Neogobius melanostomus TaxID=47308 RepID=A0A8C6SFU9_9GOBI